MLLVQTTHRGARSDKASILWNVSWVMSSSLRKSPPSGGHQMSENTMVGARRHTDDAVTGIVDIFLSAHRHFLIVQESVEDVFKGLLVISDVVEVAFLLIAGAGVFDVGLVGTNRGDLAASQFFELLLCRVCRIQTAFQRAASCIDGEDELGHVSRWTGRWEVVGEAGLKWAVAVEVLRH